MPARIDLHLVALCGLAPARILRRLGIQQRERARGKRRRKEEAGPWMDEDEGRREEIRCGGVKKTHVWGPPCEFGRRLSLGKRCGFKGLGFDVECIWVG